MRRRRVQLHEQQPELVRSGRTLQRRVAAGRVQLPRIIDSELNADVAKANSTVGDERCSARKAAQRLVLQKNYVYAMAGQASYWFARPGFEFATESATQVEPTTLRLPAK